MKNHFTMEQITEKLLHYLHSIIIQFISINYVLYYGGDRWDTLIKKKGQLIADFLPRFKL